MCVLDAREAGVVLGNLALQRVLTALKFSGQQGTLAGREDVVHRTALLASDGTIMRPVTRATA